MKWYWALREIVPVLHTAIWSPLSAEWPSRQHVVVWTVYWPKWEPNQTLRPYYYLVSYIRQNLVDVDQACDLQIAKMMAILYWGRLHSLSQHEAYLRPPKINREFYLQFWFEFPESPITNLEYYRFKCNVFLAVLLPELIPSSEIVNFSELFEPEQNKLICFWHNFSRAKLKIWIWRKLIL